MWLDCPYTHLTILYIGVKTLEYDRKQDFLDLNQFTVVLPFLCLPSRSLSMIPRYGSLEAPPFLGLQQSAYRSSLKLARQSKLPRLGLAYGPQEVRVPAYSSLHWGYITHSQASRVANQRSFHLYFSFAFVFMTSNPSSRSTPMELNLAAIIAMLQADSSPDRGCTPQPQFHAIVWRRC